jgi:ATP-dependent Zn protease
MSDPTKELAVAFHEAGHAVAALALGRPVQRVSILPNQLRLGQCELKKGSSRAAQDALETEVIILLAGMAAEARHTGEYCHGGAATDLRIARRMLANRAGSPRQLERLERRMLDKTEHLLDQRGVWPAAIAIATQLLEHTTISGRAARHLFEEAVARAENEK